MTSDSGVTIPMTISVVTNSKISWNIDYPRNLVLVPEKGLNLLTESYYLDLTSEIVRIPLFGLT